MKPACCLAWITWDILSAFNNRMPALLLATTPGNFTSSSSDILWSQTLRKAKYLLGFCDFLLLLLSMQNRPCLTAAAND